MASAAAAAVEPGDGDPAEVGAPALVVGQRARRRVRVDRFGALHRQLGDLCVDRGLGRRQVRRRALDGGRQLDLGAVRRGEVVDDLRLLLEVGQLGVVELVTPRRQGVELVHQRLGLTRRDHRPQLALQPLAVAGELGAGLSRPPRWRR